MRLIPRRAAANLRRPGIVAIGLAAAFLTTATVGAAPASAAERVTCGSPGLEIVTGLPGSYSCAPLPYGPDVMAAGQALVDWANVNLPNGTERRHFCVLSAATQVVAGTNFKVLVYVYGEPQPEVLVGTVYRALNGTMSVTEANAIGLEH